ncbi:hypothetical protein GCM10025734_33940 [Kitasatospora paranensis]
MSVEQSTGTDPGPRSGTPGGAGGPARGTGVSFTEADERKRQGVRRMKTIATGLLAFATVVFALATWADAAGAGAWAGYVAAAAEAGMVGALADWFAVTALFRRPFGLPIPHTAIIPTKKDVFGKSLGDFVGDNFLSPSVVRARLDAIGVARRLGEWLAAPGSAERVTREAAAALRGVIAVLRDEDVQAVVAEAVTRRAAATPSPSPPDGCSARSSPTAATTVSSTCSPSGSTTGSPSTTRTSSSGSPRRPPAGPRSSSTTRSASASTRN